MTMTSSMTAAVPDIPVTGAGLPDARHQEQRLARLSGLLFLAPFATSIPPGLTFYVPALSDPAFVLGGGFGTGVSVGALLELILITANVGTALTLYPVLRKHSELLSLGYVAARLVECSFIAMGIVALMALNTLRQNTGTPNPAALMSTGQALVAVHDWTFRIGPALLVAGAAVLLGGIEAGSTAQVIATVPELIWELSLGLWLLVKGFDRTTPENPNYKRDIV